MLDGLLLDEEGGRGLAGAGAAEALEDFLEEADRLAESHHFQKGMCSTETSSTRTASVMNPSAEAAGLSLAQRRTYE